MFPACNWFIRGRSCPGTFAVHDHIYSTPVHCTDFGFLREAIKKHRENRKTLRRHIVSFEKFYRIGGAPPETFPNVKYDAPEELGGDRKCFDSPIRK